MKVIISGVAAGIAAAALVSLTPAANADAGQTVMIRQGDIIASDTNADGHVEFLKEGLHVTTNDSPTAKAAEYFAVPTQALPDSASLTWYGTSPQPGSQLMFDVDGQRGNDNDFNVLVGEPTYGDDYWYTGGQARAAQRGFTCPETGGGFGGDCHGTLAEWKSTLPDSELYAAGFSLGSGVEGDGVIHDIQVGDTDYQFTDEPAITTADVTGDATVTQVDKRGAQIVKVDIATDPLGANQVEGTKLWFKITDNDDVVYHAKLGAGDEAHVQLRFPDGTGKHKVVIFKGGEVDQKVVVKTGH